MRAQLDSASDDDREQAALLVSELVTNAVVHGDGDIRVTADVAKDRARFTVSDDGPHRPLLSRPDRDAAGGRGLLIVDRLASAWGVEPEGGGKCVWFVLPLAGWRASG